jgi:glutathione S-transferase
MITLYHNNMSVCAQKVRVVLAQKNIVVQEQHLNIRAGETHTPHYLALNPKGVVPTLVVDGEPIVESSIICEYLEDAFPEHSLLPAEPSQRAAARQWTLKPEAGLHHACGTLSFATAFRFQNSAGQMAARKPGPVTSLLADLIANGLDSAELPPRLIVWAEVLDDMGARLAHHTWLADDRSVSPTSPCFLMSCACPICARNGYGKKIRTAPRSAIGWSVAKRNPAIAASPPIWIRAIWTQWPNTAPTQNCACAPCFRL